MPNNTSHGYMWEVKLQINLFSLNSVDGEMPMNGNASLQFNKNSETDWRSVFLSSSKDAFVGSNSNAVTGLMTNMGTLETNKVVLYNSGITQNRETLPFLDDDKITDDYLIENNYKWTGTISEDCIIDVSRYGFNSTQVTPTVYYSVMYDNGDEEYDEVNFPHTQFPRAVENNAILQMNTFACHVMTVFEDSNTYDIQNAVISCQPQNGPSIITTKTNFYGIGMFEFASNGPIDITIERLGFFSETTQLYPLTGATTTIYLTNDGMIASQDLATSVFEDYYIYGPQSAYTDQYDRCIFDSVSGLLSSNYVTYSYPGDPNTNSDKNRILRMSDILQNYEAIYEQPQQINLYESGFDQTQITGYTPNGGSYILPLVMFFRSAVRYPDATSSDVYQEHCLFKDQLMFDEINNTINPPSHKVTSGDVLTSTTMEAINAIYPTETGNWKYVLSQYLYNPIYFIRDAYVNKKYPIKACYSFNGNTNYFALYGGCVLTYKDSLTNYSDFTTINGKSAVLTPFSGYDNCDFIGEAEGDNNTSIAYPGIFSSSTSSTTCAISKFHCQNAIKNANWTDESEFGYCCNILRLQINNVTNLKNIDKIILQQSH